MRLNDGNSYKNKDRRGHDHGGSLHAERQAVRDDRPREHQQRGGHTRQGQL